MSEWQSERNDLNHDWLKNKLLERSNAWLDAWGTAEAFSGFRSIWPFCGPQFERIRKLIEQLDTAMSPKVLFEEEPLSRCDADTKAWLGDLMDALWRVRHLIREQQAQAKKALEQALTAWNHLAKVGVDNAVKAEVQAFRDACARLSDIISKFPHEVRVL